jgi:hypothetical protein
MRRRYRRLPLARSWLIEAGLLATDRSARKRGRALRPDPRDKPWRRSALAFGEGWDRLDG